MKRPSAHRVLDVVPEDPQEQHVAAEVQQPAVHEHRREDGEPGGGWSGPRRHARLALADAGADRGHVALVAGMGDLVGDRAVLDRPACRRSPGCRSRRSWKTKNITTLIAIRITVSDGEAARRDVVLEREQRGQRRRGTRSRSRRRSRAGARPRSSRRGRPATRRRARGAACACRAASASGGCRGSNSSTSRMVPADSSPPNTTTRPPLSAADAMPAARLAHRRQPLPAAGAWVDSARRWRSCPGPSARPPST